MTTFFQDQPTDAQLTEWANLLATAIGKSRKKPALKPIEKKLSPLRKRHGAQRVNDVLAWYCLHIGEEFVPQAYCGTTFSQKFEQIAKARASTDDLVDPMDDATKALATKLRDSCKFPVEISTKLETIIQKTKENWKVFSSKIYDAATSHKTPERHRLFLCRICQQHSCTLVADWMLLISGKYGGLSHYTGNINNVIFRSDSKLFKESFWQEWSYMWCGNHFAFDYLLEQLLKENDG
jgi:hypothetical protein